jgi:hypothetical protein
MNPVLPIWRSYDGLMVLFAQGKILFQGLGIKLGGDCCAHFYAGHVPDCKPNQTMNSRYIPVIGQRSTSAIVFGRMLLGLTDALHTVVDWFWEIA